MASIMYDSYCKYAGELCESKQETFITLCNRALQICHQDPISTPGIILYKHSHDLKYANELGRAGGQTCWCQVKGSDAVLWRNYYSVQGDGGLADQANVTCDC